MPEGIALLRPTHYTQPLAVGLVTLAWIRQATGDAAAALGAIDEAEQVAPSRTVNGLVNPAPAQRTQLLLAQGDAAAAARWAKQRGLGADDESGHPKEREYLVLAWVLLAQDRPGPALALLSRLLAQAATQGRIGSVIEMRALAASGDDSGAMAALAEALTLACPPGYVRVFADEGPPMGALLGRLAAAQRAEQTPARGIPLDCLAQLAQAFAAAPGAAVPGLVHLLTGRELEVRGKLAAGTPNQAIAGEPFGTLSTVKKHVSRVLAKLGAANRIQAVARARELGLIP